jgi:hypothetical protein
VEAITVQPASVERKTMTSPLSNADKEKELPDIKFGYKFLVSFKKDVEQQLLTEIMGELPEKYTKDEHPVAFHNGFNEALDAVVAVIKQRMDGGLATSEEAQSE